MLQTIDRSIDLSQATQDYAIVEQAIRYLDEQFQQQPSLAEIAAALGLSEYHFQRLFSRWAGISPKRFLQFLTKEYAKQALQRSRSLLETTYEAGLSSPGRLHDLFVTCEGVTPGEYKQRGSGLTIHYGFHSTPFGPCLLATTERGICGLSFLARGVDGTDDQSEDRAQALRELKEKWPAADLQPDAQRTQPLAEQIFAPAHAQPMTSLHLFIQGTNFQIKVWEALLQIPAGAALSYQDVARYIGQPQAARAVGNAVARNPVAYLIPCHRVLRQTGAVSNYRWGRTRKKAILGWEAAHADGDANVAD